MGKQCEKEKTDEMMGRRLIGFFIVIASFVSNLSAQSVNGCSLSLNDWQEIWIDQGQGKKILTINYQNCSLDLSDFQFLTFEVVNDSDVDIAVDVYQKGEVSWKIVQGRAIVKKNEAEIARYWLLREYISSESPWFSEFGSVRALPGNRASHWNAFDLQNIVSIQIEISWMGHKGVDRCVKLKTPYGSGNYTFESISFEDIPRPIVDEMGQSKMDEWENKLSNKSELIDLGTADLDSFQNVEFGHKFTKYGGWKEGPRMQATGNFYTKKYNGKWWLVDPEGYLFWSQGVTGVGATTATPVSGRATLFPDFNDEKGLDLWTEMSQQVKNNQINFYALNLIRKYGANWENAQNEVNYGRLKYWGLNTCGAWSKIPDSTYHPYTLIIHPAKQGIGSISKMIDPFSSEFESSVRSNINGIKYRNGDPWLVGVFVNNELDWDEEMNVPYEILKLNNTTPARKELEEFLINKYGTISSLNQSWGSNFVSFTAISGNNSGTFKSSFQSDLREYFDHFSDTYFRVINEELERALPNHLYLGCRFKKKSFNNKIVQNAASRYCDVVSFNNYNFDVSNLNLTFEKDKPVIIGEFHFGTGSHGVWGTGLVSAPSVEEQGQLYQKYIEVAVENPKIIGAHWFKWVDQMATGRKDGENFRIGIVNVTDQPYLPLVDKIKETSESIFDRRMGNDVTLNRQSKLGESKDLFEIYPNPSDGKVSLELYKDGEAVVEIRNTLGHLIWQTNVSSSAKFVFPDTIKGICFVQVQQNESVNVKRLVVN